MSINEQRPMSRRYATAVIVIVVAIVAYGFSKGWFGSASRSPEVEGTKVSVSQPIDQESASTDAAQVVEVGKQPVRSTVQ